ncbi:hypothetical protein M514_00354, partial [Trichuris suis]
GQRWRHDTQTGWKIVGWHKYFLSGHRNASRTTVQLDSKVGLQRTTRPRRRPIVYGAAGHARRERQQGRDDGGDRKRGPNRHSSGI